MKHKTRGARNQTSARQTAGRGRGGGVSGGIGGQQVIVGTAAPGIGMTNVTTGGIINNNAVATTAVNHAVTNLTVPDIGSLTPVAPSQVVLPTQPYQQMVPQTVTAQMAPLHQQQYQQHPQQQQHQVLQQHPQQQQMHLLQPGAMTGQKLIRRGHQIELLTQAKILCDRQDFVDLTIYCEDGVVRAHQMLLAVASPFLKLLFQTSPLYGTDEISLVLPEVKACLVQALIHFVYTGTVVSKEDHFYSLMKLVYALNINASIEAESTNDRPTTFTAPLVPPHTLNPVLRLHQQTPHYLAQQQQQIQIQQQQQQFQTQQTFQQPMSQQLQHQQQTHLLQSNTLPQPILPTQPVPLHQSMNGLVTASATTVNNAAALVAQITQPAIAPPNVLGPPHKVPRLSGPPANAVPVPPQNLGLTHVSPSKTMTSSLPHIQLPTQPVPMVNGIVKGTEAPAAGQVTQQHLQQTVNQQQHVQQQQFAIAVDPQTGISYKVDMTNGQMCATSELTSNDPLAAIMNETIFTDTSGAIVPAPNAAMYTTDNGQVIYTTQPPPNATATIPTNMQISQGTQLITSPSGGIQLASVAPQQIHTQVQLQTDVNNLGSNATRAGGRAGGRGGRAPAGGRGTKRKNPSNSQQQQNSTQVNNTNIANNNRTTGGISSADDDGVLAESVDDLPCAPDDEDINTPYPCPSCNKTIKGRVMLQAHHFQEHYDNPELGTTMQASSNDKHACRVCLKFFTRNSDVKAHILRVHCGDRRYPCTMCGKRFKESTHLRKHLYTHTGERPHYCSLCNKGFQTSSDLKRHKRTRVHQERVEQAGGIDPIDTAVPVTGTGTTTTTTGGGGGAGGGASGIKGWSDTDDDSSVSGVQIAGAHNTSTTSSVGGPNDAGTTAQALLNSITEPVPVVPSGPGQGTHVGVATSMVGGSSGSSAAATSVVTMVAPTRSRGGGAASFSNNTSTIDMKIIAGQQQQTYVNNTSGGGIVTASGGQPSSVTSVGSGGPLDLKDLTSGGTTATNADNADAGMADMNAFIENAAREVTGTADSEGVSSMPVVSTNGGPAHSLAHATSGSISTTAATVVVSAPSGTASQNTQNSLNMSGTSTGGNVVNHQTPMVVTAGPPTPTEPDLPPGMPVVTTEASSSSLMSSTMNNQHLTNMKTTENKTGLIQSLGSGRTSSQPATVIVSASQSSSSSSMPTISGVGGPSTQQQKSNSAFDDLKRNSSLDSPGHDEERLTVVESMDDSSQEVAQGSSSSNAIVSGAKHPTPAAVVVPLIKSKVDSSSTSS